MKKEKLERDLQELREQVALLKARLPTGGEFEEEAPEAGVTGEGKGLTDSRAKPDFIGKLHEDLRNLPVTTAVGILAVGLLLGRILSR